MLPINVKANVYHSDAIKVDPDGILPPQFQTRFLRVFGHVFDPEFPGYNGAVGPFQAVVNVGPVLPPQMKGRARGMLQKLQQKLNKLFIPSQKVEWGFQASQHLC